MVKKDLLGVTFDMACAASLGVFISGACLDTLYYGKGGVPVPLRGSKVVAAVVFKVRRWVAVLVRL